MNKGCDFYEKRGVNILIIALGGVKSNSCQTQKLVYPYMRLACKGK